MPSTYLSLGTPDLRLELASLREKRRCWLEFGWGSPSATRAAARFFLLRAEGTWTELNVAIEEFSPSFSSFLG